MNSASTDETKSILTASVSDPVVWQTWSNDSDAFVAKGSSPKKWCQQNAISLDDVANAEPEFAKLGARAAAQQKRYTGRGRVDGGRLSDRFNYIIGCSEAAPTARPHAHANASKDVVPICPHGGPTS